MQDTLYHITKAPDGFTCCLLDTTASFSSKLASLTSLTQSAWDELVTSANSFHKVTDLIRSDANKKVAALIATCARLTDTANHDARTILFDRMEYDRSVDRPGWPSVFNMNWKTLKLAVDYKPFEYGSRNDHIEVTLLAPDDEPNPRTKTKYRSIHVDSMLFPKTSIRTHLTNRLVAAEKDPEYADYRREWHQADLQARQASLFDHF